MFIEGGLYHVYNRVTRGERVFAEEGEADRLLGMLHEAARRDGMVVLAFSILPNHFHLAVRTTGVPLWRTMASVQNRFARSFNGRRRVYGPFWQGRYRAKLVQDSRHLQQLAVYIHLNPVAAGLVADAAEYRWSGHREVLDLRRRGLVDTAELLLLFGTRREAARRGYLATIGGGSGEEWARQAPGRLPWWRLGRPPKRENDELEVPADRPFLDALGRSTGRERPRLDADTLLEVVCRRMGVSREQLGSRTKARQVVRTRELVVTLGVERYDLKVRELAVATGARYDTVSLWGRRGAQRRCGDPAFNQVFDELDADLCKGDAIPPDAAAGGEAGHE